MFVYLRSRVNLADVKYRLRRHAQQSRGLVDDGNEYKIDIICPMLFPIILLRRRIEYMNSYAPVFYGILWHKGDSTRLAGLFLFHPVVCVFTFIWLLFVYLSPIPGIGLFLFFLFALLVVLCLLLAKDHVRLIRTFLSDILRPETVVDGVPETDDG